MSGPPRPRRPPEEPRALDAQDVGPGRAVVAAPVAVAHAGPLEGGHGQPVDAVDATGRQVRRGVRARPHRPSGHRGRGCPARRPSGPRTHRTGSRGSRAPGRPPRRSRRGPAGRPGCARARAPGRARRTRPASGSARRRERRTAARPATGWSGDGPSIAHPRFGLGAGRVGLDRGRASRRGRLDLGGERPDRLGPPRRRARPARRSRRRCPPGRRTGPGRPGCGRRRPSSRRRT